MGSLFFLFLWISPQKQKIPNFLLNQDMRIRGQTTIFHSSTFNRQNNYGQAAINIDERM